MQFGNAGCILYSGIKRKVYKNKKYFLHPPWKSIFIEKKVFLRQGLKHPRSGPPQERSDEEDGTIVEVRKACFLRSKKPPE